MGYALILVGLVLTISGVRGTQAELYDQVQKDFSGDRSFLWWVAAIGSIGALGYIPQLQSLSRAFLVLVLIVLVLSNGTVFDQFTNAIRSTSNAPPQQPANGTTGK